MANGKVPQDVKELLRHGSNYPCAILMDDGELICTRCARKEYKQLAWCARHKENSGWRPIAAVSAVYAEEHTELCAHCGNVIADLD